MKMQRIRLLTSFLVVVSTCAIVTPGTTQQKRPSVAVYNQNLGFVKEIRSIELREGIHKLSLKDLPDSIDPSSVHATFTGSSGTASILEQHFEYDLVDANKLLSKYVGNQVEIIMASGDTVAGRLLNSRTDLVVELANGQIKLIRNREANVIGFPGLPEGLITEATLTWTVDSERSGRRDIVIQYLTRGMNWSAEYMALLDEKNQMLDIKAWINVDNQSGKDFLDSKLKLVAGELNLVRPGPTFARPMIAAEMKVQSDVSREEAFEYHVYSIDRPVDLPNNEMKQVALFKATGIKYERQYVLDSTDPRYQTNVRAGFKNEVDNGLGTPFPAGRFRVYTAGDQESSLFLGEDRIYHSPVNELIQVNLGVAFDVAAERKQVEVDRIGTNGRRESFEIKIRNHKAEPIEIVCKEYFRFRMPESTWKIVQSSAEYQIQDAERAEFYLSIPAGGEGLLAYAVEYSW